MHRPAACVLYGNKQRGFDVLSNGSAVSRADRCDWPCRGSPIGAAFGTSTISRWGGCYLLRSAPPLLSFPLLSLWFGLAGKGGMGGGVARFKASLNYGRSSPRMQDERVRLVLLFFLFCLFVCFFLLSCCRIGCLSTSEKKKQSTKQESLKYLTSGA